MNYLDELTHITEEFKEINSEGKFFEFLKPRFQKRFSVMELSAALARSNNYWQNKEDCETYMVKLFSWCENTYRMMIEYNLDDDNVKVFESFKNAVDVFCELIKLDVIDRKIMLQESIHLTILFDDFEFKHFESTKQASSHIFGRTTHKAINLAGDFINLFLNIFHNNIDTSGAKEYFKVFSHSKLISFPVAFLDSNLNQAAIETCRIWLDIEYGSNLSFNSDPLFISLNRKGNFPIEEKVIGESIKTAILEAEKHFNDLIHNKKNCNIKHIFFQIGNLTEDYDGDSIGAAVFFATLTLLDSRTLPKNLFFTGRLNANDQQIAGILEKAKAGLSNSFNTIIIPKENLAELTQKLKKNKFDYSIRNEKSDILPEDTKDHLAIFPYEDQQSLFNLWDAWKDVSGKSFKLNKRPMFSTIVVASVWWFICFLVIRGVYSPNEIGTFGIIIIYALPFLLLTFAAHNKLPGLGVLRDSLKKIQRERYMWSYKKIGKYALFWVPYTIVLTSLFVLVPDEHYWIAWLIGLIAIVVFLWALFTSD